MPNPQIIVKDLSKRFRIRSVWFRFREIMALNGVSFEVMPGEAFGVIGPNGSGKSTLLRILSTILIPSSGHVSVCGYSINQIQKVKPLVGVVPSEASGFWSELSGRQNLEFFATLQKLNAKLIRHRIEELLQILGLSERDEQPFWTYSTGQRQRLNIARALLHDPPILLFDEPTKGLDPWGAHSIRRWIRSELIEKQKRTLLIATNQFEDVSDICGRIFFLKFGKMAWQGPAERLSRPELLSICD